MLVLIIESTATVAALRSDPIIAFFLPLLILLVLRIVQLHEHEPVHIKGECEVEEKVQSVDKLTTSGVDVDVAGRCPRLPSDFSKELMKLIGKCKGHILDEERLLSLLHVSRISAIRHLQLKGCLALQQFVKVRHGQFSR